MSTTLSVRTLLGAWVASSCRPVFLRRASIVRQPDRLVNVEAASPAESD